jgi:hypothetical protein
LSYITQLYLIIMFFFLKKKKITFLPSINMSLKFLKKKKKSQNNLIKPTQEYILC